MTELNDLLDDGLIERVPRDAVAAARRLQEAATHLDSVSKIAPADPDGAYSLLWDAARKAISAHMIDAGYRAKSDRPGAHRAIVLYAEATLSGELGPVVRNLDRMRRIRNSSEYGPRSVGESEVANDLTVARAVVDAVQRVLGRG